MVFLAFLFAALCVPLQAQSAPTNQQVGTKVNLSGLQFGKPFVVDYSAPPPIVQILSVDTNTSDGGQTVVTFIGSEGGSFRIQATAYSPRPYQFPSLLVQALDDAGNTNTFYTPSFSVPISNELATNTNALALADIVPAPYVWNHLWTILLALGALLTALAIFLWKRRRPAPPKAKAEEDPFIALQRRLNALKVQQKQLGEHTYKEFFVELSEVTREILSLTVAPLAMESPTREILEILKQHRVSEPLMDAARFTLRTCDAAKYAKAIFPQERIDEVMACALTLYKKSPRPAADKDKS